MKLAVLSPSPNAGEDRVLEEEDRLQCFGKLSEMCSLIPARRRRRARPKPQPLPSDPFALVADLPEMVVHGA